MRAKLLSKQQGMERSEKMKKLREMKKFGKKVRKDACTKFNFNDLLFSSGSNYSYYSACHLGTTRCFTKETKGEETND